MNCLSNSKNHQNNQNKIYFHRLLILKTQCQHVFFVDYYLLMLLFALSQKRIKKLITLKNI